MLQNDDKAFSYSLTYRIELYKFAMSIGIMNAYVEEYCVLFEPVYVHIYYFKSKIDAGQGSKAKTLSPEFLSKIWNIHPDLAAKTLNQITKLNRQVDDNELF